MKRLKDILNYHVGKFLFNFLLMLIFIIANIIFGNSFIVSCIIMGLAIIIGVSVTSSPFDETTPIMVGFIVGVTLWVGYLWLKIFLFKIIYKKVQSLDTSAILFKFLNTFLYNPKIKALTILLALLFDIIIMAIYAYIHYKSIAPKDLFLTPENIPNVLFIGGLAPCYIIFALIGKISRE